jgi:outer membrane protein assembly factor BamB
MNWKVQNAKLIVNGQLIGLPGPAEKAVEFDGVIVVLLEHYPPRPAVGDRNVVGIDAATGVQKWQISAEPWPEGLSNPATQLWKKDRKVWLFFGRGINGMLDVVTGRVTIPKGQRPW